MTTQFYLLASAVAFTILSLVWSRANGLNLLIKVLFVCMAVAGFVLRFAP